MKLHIYAFALYIYFVLACGANVSRQTSVSYLSLTPHPPPSPYEIQDCPPYSGKDSGLNVTVFRLQGANGIETTAVLATISNPQGHFHIYAALNSTVPCGSTYNIN